MRARARVLIHTRAGVLDPEGQAIHAGLKRLGFEQVISVGAGKVIELEVEGEDLDEIEALVVELCEALLVNPIMQDYTIDALEARSP